MVFTTYAMSSHNSVSPTRTTLLIWYQAVPVYKIIMVLSLTAWMVTPGPPIKIHPSVARGQGYTT